MLDVSGMLKIIIKAGKASSIVPHLMCETLAIIKLPTIISAGAVIADKPETALTNGPKNMESKNKIPTVSEVRPVRPPAATPEDDSINALVGLVPKIAPKVVAMESESRAWRARGSVFPFISPACWATPTMVPVVSKMVTSKKENTTAYKL